MQDHLGAHSLKETLNFETQGFKGEDEMDKLGNNFKMLLRNGELKCVLKAGYNANIAQDTGIHPGDLSVEAADLQCVKEKKSVMPSP